MNDTLLIIEDERLLGAELKRYYGKKGWEVELVGSAAHARQRLMDLENPPLVVLSDMNLPDGNGLDLLEESQRVGARAEWVFLTGYGSVPDSVRALRLGACDYLEKPCDQDRLDVVINAAARSSRAHRRLSEQSEQRSRRFGPDAFLGSSDAASKARLMLERLSSVPFSSLIITGETGTGKGLAARILHHSGARAAEPLVEVNCAALPASLLESELFGHEAGAFTGAKGRRKGLFEQAHGGTLFLDEIGEMDIELQSKLLSAIEDRKIRRLGGERTIDVDVQIIAATNQDLQARVSAGEFRSDLFHRLSAFEIELPALRDRKEDLEALVPALIEEFNATANRRVRNVGASVWSALRAHNWPGNIRELRNVIERMVLFADGEDFPADWLQLKAPSIADPTELVDGDRVTIPLDGSIALEDMDRLIIQTALDRNDFNVTATARVLGTTRETLRYRVQKYGLAQMQDAEQD
ncbi:MAG: sigma-54-dependent Fis family transcriptional regulator [Gammaproteobacteria bacterium]|nr:sigma-54-dependent Fis family transcriptional regulator [Gammaproteobacteria bacterium]